MKKLSALLLVLAVMLLFAAAHGESADFTFDAGLGIIESYNGAGGEVVVPAEIDGTEVKALKYGVFNSNDDVTTIVLPDTLEAIGSNNFFGCAALTEVVVPARVAFIDYGCFSWNDNLKAVTFLGEAPVFGGDGFSALPADFVCYVPDDQYDAYRAALPDDIAVETTGHDAVTFDWTAAESDFDFDAATGAVTGYHGSAARVDVPAEIGGIPVKAIGESAFERNEGIYLVNLPDVVETVGAAAFKNAYNLQAVSLPDSLRVIGDEAFSGGWHSANISFPASLEEIGRSAFAWDSISGGLHFEGRALTIGDNAFENSRVQELYLDDSPVRIGSHAFQGSALSYLCFDTYSLLDGIAADAFEGADRLADLDLPWDSPLENQQAWRAFMAEQAPNCYVWINNPTDCSSPYGDDATYETYPDGTFYLAAYTGDLEALVNYHTMDGVSITGIGDGVFKGNQTLKKFRATHSDKFTTIGAEAFADSAVEVVDLYYTTETIGAGAFRNCVNLTELTIPASVTSIGEGAFDGCANLQKVTLLCSADALPRNAFASCDALRGNPDSVILAADATDAQVARVSADLGCPWFSPVLRAGEARTELQLASMPFAPTDAAAFEFDAETGTITGYNGSDADVIVPREIDGVAVTAIGYNAFESCRDYTDTDMPTNRESWTHLRSVVLPETVIEISDSAFSYCQQLETFICYGPAISTGRGTFLLCRNLRNVIFVNGVGMIDNYAFEGTDSFETFYSPVPLQYLGISAFVNSGLTSFVVDARSVGNGAFTDCPYLYELHFTDAVEEVDAAVANRCGSLYEICYETADLSFIPNDGLIAGAEGYVTIRVPEGTDEENLACAQRSLIWGTEAEAGVITGECDRVPAELPDVEAIMAAYADDPYIAPEPEPTPEPIEAAPVGEAGEPYLGAWMLDEIVVGDERYSADDFGMNMTFVFNADGTVQVGEDGESATGAWSVTGDGLRLDAMGETLLLTPTEDGRLVQEEDGAQMFLTRGDGSNAAPAPATEPADEPEPMEEPVAESPAAEAGGTPDLSDYVGEWHGVWLQTGGLIGDPRAQFGLDIVLTLNADGWGDLDYGGSDGGMSWGWDAESENVYYGLDNDAAMPLFLLDDGFLRYGTQYSGYIVFSKNAEAIWTPEETAVIAEPTIPAIPAAEPDAPVGDVEFVENKFVCTAAESGGYAIDISMLGGEYSVIFHADGTASFTMAGTELPGLHWTQDGSDYVIDYYGQGELRFSPSGTGLLLDFMGSMQMTFEAE